ncbi:hypothetical protein GOODEAATRI_030396 [Goodea atripinnis]|uniref:Uncharacterized protein n=1 Tax=Goodea atripinnis TaxID=208336 RepID=A0ABV0NEX3_9TELE
MRFNFPVCFYLSRSKPELKLCNKNSGSCCYREKQDFQSSRKGNSQGPGFQHVSLLRFMEKWDGVNPRV